jgi:hypothetical protein
MDEWSAEAWSVVGPWIDGKASSVPDPNGGGPWLPTLDAVKDSLNSVEAAWRKLQPPAVG